VFQATVIKILNSCFGNRTYDHLPLTSANQPIKYPHQKGWK